MAKQLKCPECGWTYTPINDKQIVLCNGKRTKDSIEHKQPKRMK